MKLLKKVLIYIICILTLCGCSQDELGKYRRKGQVIDIKYQELSEKLINDESFIFFLKRKDCPGCASFYPTLKEFLDNNKEKVIHVIDADKIQPVDQLTLSSYYVEALGSGYYEENELSSTRLWTPSICKVINGEFVYAQIGHLTLDSLNYIYQDNYYSLDSYYGYNRRVQKKETFNLFISINGDSNYDQSLREYFVNNSDVKGYYLNSNKFDESENERLLNRVNYYLGEGNDIETLPEYCLLQYENGKLINFVNAKYDETSLNSLYKK